jgi:hypothetical protein
MLEGKAQQPRHCTNSPRNKGQTRAKNVFFQKEDTKIIKKHIITVQQKLEYFSCVPTIAANFYTLS